MRVVAWRSKPGEIVVEALIDGDSTLHVTPQGIYWKSHGAAEPGLHGGRDEATTINGVAWKPKWALPGERGNDTSDVFAMKVGSVANLKVEIVGCAGQPGTTTVETRTPISTSVAGDEFVVTIPDKEGGSRWYRLRLFQGR